MGMSGRYTVFVVDEAPRVREFVSSELGRIGCRVSCFCDGQECLERLCDDECHLVIADAELEGLEGEKFLERVKRAGGCGGGGSGSKSRRGGFYV